MAVVHNGDEQNLMYQTRFNEYKNNKKDKNNWSIY